MTVYVVQINNQLSYEVFTSLKTLCDKHKLSYSSVTKKFQGAIHLPVSKFWKGKGMLRDQWTVYIITKCKLVKIKGRENNARKLSNL